MRFRTICLGLLALSSVFVACNGRVSIGKELSASGGAGGDGTVSPAEAGASGEGGAPPAPSWFQKWSDSAAAGRKAGVTFLNLADPSSEWVTVDGELERACPFSPDGRLACAMRRIDADTQELVLIDASGSTLGAPLPLGSLTNEGDCSWPDPTRLICIEPAHEEPEFVSFDSTRATAPTRTSGRPVSSLYWSSAGALFFSDDRNEVVRVEWPPGERPRTTGTGLYGAIVRLSASGDRAVVLIDDDSGQTTSLQLLDLETLDHVPLGEFKPVAVTWWISASFRSFVAAEIVARDDLENTFRYSYYRLDGMRPQLVESREQIRANEERAARPPQFAGDHLVTVEQGRVWLTSVTSDDVIEQEVPGDYQEISSLDISPDERWLTFTSLETAVGDRRPRSRWVLGLSAQGIQSSTTLPQFTTETHARFSPDSSKLLVAIDELYQDNTTPREPAVVFDLNETGPIERRKLDAEHDWSDIVWSADASFFALRVPSDTQMTQSLLVVDTTDASRAPREVWSCSEVTSEQGCQISFAFQR